jgi:hypothetical protein
MSPEECGLPSELKDHVALSRAHDVYAFGIIALQLLSPTTPYVECTTVQEVYDSKTALDNPAALAQIMNERHRDFIRRCMVLQLCMAPQPLCMFCIRIESL